MNRIKVIFAAGLFFAFSAVFAQEEAKIAVYVTGNMGANEKEALSTKMLSSFVQSGKYNAIENAGGFFSGLQEYEKSKALDNSQIIAFGKQFGAQFVCLVNIKPAFDSYHVSASIINTETSAVVIMGETSNTLKSFDDLTNVTNELSAQLLKQPSQATAAAIPAAEEQKQCDKKYNINELIFKIQSSFSAQLKDCGTTLAKNMALASSPFGKKTSQPEPKSFMLQCTIDGMKAKLPLGFPNMDKITDNIQNFVQTLLNESSANGQLDTKKLLKAIDEMKIDGLLGVIKDLAIGNACVVDEPYEGEVVVSEYWNEKLNYKEEYSIYENFGVGRRFGTIFLNIIPGLGSLTLMGDWTGAIVQWTLFGVGSGLQIIGGEQVAGIGGKNRKDEYLVGSGITLGFLNYGYNIYRSITYDKPKNVAYNKQGNFNVAVLPNRKGDGVAYGLFYGVGF